jgi:long-chain acyl-CoA synthetase
VIDNEKMNMLLFTSGTTDLAKGVMLSHKNICSDITAITSCLYIDDTDTALSILPLHHTYECTAGFLVMVYNGCCITFCEGLKYIGKNIKEIKPSIVMLVPLILENVYKKIWETAKKKPFGEFALLSALALSNFLSLFGIDVRKKLFKSVHESLGGNLRLVISGAAGLAPHVSKGFRDFGLNVIQGYGLTECSPIVSVNRDEDFRHDSIGLPISGVEVKLDNVDFSGIGEIIVKGDIVMLGYFENPVATRKVLKNGWLYTGDLGTIDSDGFIKITGRKKSVIVTKNGKNIFPEEVEAYLSKSKYILESLVTGELEEASGETIVTAEIFPDYDNILSTLKVDRVDDKEVYKIINAEVKKINKSMPLYKHVRNISIREYEFEKTTSRKIKRYGQQAQKIG